MEEKKLCRCSKIPKPLSEFYKKKRTNDGYDYICKVCKIKQRKEKYLMKKEVWMDGIIF